MCVWDNFGVEEFREAVWGYYRSSGRDLPWRNEPFDQYGILVAELMLQQTQVQRVIPKYESFMQKYPTIKDLAQAPLSDVLVEWSGLGYNRRAKYLHEAAKQLQPVNVWTMDDLTSCKGIGKNTAAAVLAYSQNVPIVFTETNIRTVYIHHFFNDRDDVDDRELLPLIEASLDREHPREWYWALMDYGTYLKKSVGNVSRQSKHYAKQSVFAGSVRQLRGEVLRQLAAQPMGMDDLHEIIADQRLADVLRSLEKDGLVQNSSDGYALPR